MGKIYLIKQSDRYFFYFRSEQTNKNILTSSDHVKQIYTNI